MSGERGHLKHRGHPVCPYTNDMEWMAGQVRKGRYLYCPNGSHMALYDDQKVYFGGLVQFIRDVNAGRF
jgi:hypothetical protein